MAKKVFLPVLLLIISLFALTGCASKDIGSPNDQNNNQFNEVSNNVSERKIIYKVSADIHTDDLEMILSEINENLGDGWVENKVVEEDKAYIVIRIKSNRIDTFLNVLSHEGTINKLRQTSTDVSLNYFDKTHRINSLNAELDRLIELKKDANNLSQLIEIESRITDVEYELMKLTQELNQLDSEIEYSTITFNIYQNKEKVPFGRKIIGAFLAGLNAFLEFMKIVLIVVAVLIPFSIIFVPIVLVGKNVVKKRKVKKIEEIKKLMDNN